MWLASGVLEISGWSKGLPKLPGQRLVREEVLADVRAAIGAFPPREHEVLALGDFEELTMREVGAALGHGRPSSRAERGILLGRVRTQVG